ncbi:hypothetical protein NCAS_0B07770 [Naumovozyma castellii]|uniref:TRIP4/RQT4 C2HC5-type zinc finger domain-containing protein n=1 Tax=Naumovozyma castellii TaxID=27288 RepID=G0VAD1_NAUCA|nr:hypothetical protein NCAS_0B07770 [Naumovozyma castellii CBS 4309]CCC68861.1 hypothetical protein NCAS_0B07770 [Naumovozyma castellii CBS 4309]
MTKTQAIQYALTKVPEILPLEQDDVKQLCENIISSSHNPEAIAQGFLDILGHDDLSFEFVMKFNELLGETEKPVSPSVNEAISEQISNPPSRTTSKTNLRNERKKTTNLKPANGQLVSDVIKEPSRAKQSKQPSKQSKSTKSKTVQSLQEIDDAVRFLELDEKNVSSSGKYICNCQGLRHPIFDIAPNCLSCGKIICIKEGLHLNNCSFCGTELIPIEERVKLIQVLKDEKEQLNEETEARKTQQKQASRKPVKTYKISSGMGKNLFTEQDKLFDFIERKKERERKLQEVLKDKERHEEEIRKADANKLEEENKDKDLIAAQDRLEKLLHFQDTSAERTKIIDNASDFSMSDEAGLWGSARERALMLKKQQRNLRKWEKLENERNGKRDKYVVSMDIGPNGKVTMKEVSKDKGNVFAGSDDELDEISDEEDAEDLRAIKNLKKEITENKELETSELQSSTWDYEKDQKKFQRLKYVGKPSSPDSEKDEEPPTSEWKSRVQISADDKNALEENILAVL